MAGWSVWVLLTPVAPTVLWLTATFRVLLGAFEGPYIPASVAAVARAIPSNRQARPVLRFRAVRCTARTRGRRVLRRHHPEQHRIAGLDFRDLWPDRIWPGPPHGGATRKQFRRPGAARRPRGNGRVPRNGRRKRRFRFGFCSRVRRCGRFYIGYFALPYCQYLFLTWLPQYLTSLPSYTADPSERDFRAAVLGRLHRGEFCRMGDGLARGGGLDQRWIPPQILHRRRRHDLRGHDFDRGDDGFQHAGGDHDHHRQCGSVVLRDPVSGRSAPT